MDDLGDHADQVLSDLRDAVGVADEKLIHLQEELDLLESKARSEEQYTNGKHLSSNISDFDDNDISKYLEEYANNTTDESLPSICSSPPRTSIRNTNNESTKLFVTRETEIKQTYGTDRPYMQNNEDPISKTKAMTTLTTKSYEDDYHENHGNMRDMAAVFPGELFSHILHPAGHRHSSTPKSREDFNDRDQDRLEIQHKGHVREEGNKFFIPAFDINRNEKYFKPIRTEVLSSRSDGDSARHDVQIRNAAVLETNQKLLENFESEKKKNKKLTEKLTTLEKDLAELQMKYELHKHEEETGKILVIVDEIQHAQKTRENAMMDRLRVAAKDRDEALLRTKALHVKNLHLQKMDKSSPYRKRDKTLMEIMDHIATADSGRIVEKYGNELVERIDQLRDARSRITSEEMNVIIKERDDAIARCHSLELELHNCLEELNLLKRTKDTSVSSSLKAKVLETRQEKAQTQKKLHTAEDEIEMLRIYYSLHKSLTLEQDKGLAERYNEYMTNIREEAMKRAQQAKQVEAENKQLHDKLLLVTQEKCLADDKNKKLQTEFDHLKEKCSKLERLVKVLRRKLVNHIQSQSNISISSRQGNNISPAMDTSTSEQAS